MTMLPVCSATGSCSYHAQVSFSGCLPLFSPFRKEIESIVEERVALTSSNGTLVQRVSFKTQATKSFFSVIEGPEQLASMGFMNQKPCANEFDYTKCEFPITWSPSIGATQEPLPVDLKFVENSSITAKEEELMDFTDQLNENANNLMGRVELDTTSANIILPENSTSVSGSTDFGNDSLSSVKTSFDDFFARVTDFVTSSINKGEDAVKSSLDTFQSSIYSFKTGASEAADYSVSSVFSTADRTGELASNRLGGLSTDLKEATSKATVIVADTLRNTIVALEDSIKNGATFVVYSYGTAKELFSPEIRDALNLSEEQVIRVLKPVGTAFQQVNIAIEGVEKSLGLDPNDPVVPFVFFLGSSATLWAFNWVWTYGGYSGDLPPTLTLEFLTGKGNVVLIDVRPEVLRERDGIPDLRRAARFRYASVTLPEVDGPVRKLLRNGRDLDDTLIAAVIRNLKVVQDRSDVIVMDANGTRSKGIARALRKLGIKRPYLVKGGFQSWAKEGLRIKELKPETVLTILNEDAEAILEDIRPSPLQVLVYGAGFAAASYALLEWEKTLQLIGILGLVLTIYQRVVSYEGAEDLKQDLRLLLAPVTFGSQAISWVSGKLETNRIGLPTSPSSLDVQNRVLQAAAKHESQPSDSEGIQDPSAESLAPLNENVDLSEA